MARLVVQVVDASDLMPEDGQGSASPFVEVEFDDETLRTETKPKELNPYWGETLGFNISDPRDIAQKTIVVTVYSDHRGNGHHKDFLGRIRISGVSVALSESEASVQRYPLDEKGLFSHVKGDIGLKIYAVHDGSGFTAPMDATSFDQTQVDQTPVQEIDTNKLDEEVKSDEKKQQKKKREKEVRVFHSIGTGGGGGHKPAPAPVSPTVSSGVETRADFAKAGGPAATVMHMQVPLQNPEFVLMETNPPVAARMRYRGGDKTASTDDLVEQMHYLYVSVVEARDLPVNYVSGSLDPYVEVKLGNYKGVTKHLEKNQNPVWKQIFAFAKEGQQAHLLEVTVKDKDFVKDDFVGRVLFNLTEVPLRVPPDSPLAPQWYKLADKKGEKSSELGEIMLAVWMGTQADESFPEARHSDAHSVSHQNLANIRSKVYFSPQLCYLRVHVLEAQDLVPSEQGRVPDALVKVQLGNQIKVTRPMRTINPIWKDELMFVASEPFEDLIVVSVEDKLSQTHSEVLGRTRVPVREVPSRLESGKLPEPKWISLLKPQLAEQEGQEKKKEKFSSKILLRFVLEGGYHVLDEETLFSSDLQPSSKFLRKPNSNIGLLELGILSAKNLQPMKSKEGKTTDAYCVAKYGNKWVRTRTLRDTLNPRWNEQYTWDVYDLCTVITIGVFDNHHINGKDDVRDLRIGKVRIRLSTLETDRRYTHFYPLSVLTPSGLKKYGELQLALRFTCLAWVNMVALYGRSLLPKMHYVEPISVRHINLLRYWAQNIIADRLGRSEPPIRREVIEYMLDVEIHMWSLRKSKANFSRILSLVSETTAVRKWYNDICYWRNPISTCVVHVLFLILVCYPKLILPTIFLSLFVIGMWNYWFGPRYLPHMDARLSQAITVNPHELEELILEEFDTFPTSIPADIVRFRYDRLRSLASRVNSFVEDLASQGERAQAILRCRDPRATAMFIIFSLIWVVLLCVTPFQVIAVLAGLYLLRHPRFRSKMPSLPVNFFERLPNPKYISKARIVKRLMNIPPTRAKSEASQSFKLAPFHSSFFLGSEAVMLSAILCKRFFLLLSNHPIRFLPFRSLSNISFAETLLSSDVVFPPQPSGPQAHDCGSAEYAQLSDWPEHEERIS